MIGMRIVWPNKTLGVYPNKILRSELQLLFGEAAGLQHIPLRHISYAESELGHLPKVLDLPLLLFLSWLETLTQA